MLVDMNSFGLIRNEITCVLNIFSHCVNVLLIRVIFLLPTIGFLLAANALDALLQEEVSNMLSQLAKNDPPYTLLLTGHSLGAGVATVLTVKWRKLFPSIRSEMCLLWIEYNIFESV
jgi:hypothetical protein